MTIADISYVPPQVVDTIASFNSYADTMRGGDTATYRYYVTARWHGTTVIPCEREAADVAVIIVGHGLLL